MGLSSKIILALGLCVASSAAQAVTCNGNQAPDWDACDAIAAQFNGATGYLDKQLSQDNTCTGFKTSNDDTSHNCQLTVCYGRDSGEAHVAFAYIYTDYQFIKDQCQMENAGGRTFPPSNEGYQYLGVSNNPDFVPSKEKREHARDLHSIKRQEQGDNGYTLYSKSTSISKPGGRYPVTGRLTSGSTFTTTKSSSMSTGIENAVSVGANFFDIFSASVGLTVSQDYTVSSSTGITVKVDCASGQEGIIYWVPLYTYYRGYYTPSNDEVDFYVPSDSVGSRSNYEVSCLG